MDNMKWYKHKTEIHRSANSEKVVVYSRCPKCGDGSWAHWEKWFVDEFDKLLSSELDPKGDKDE